jgi:class 3 adenylate cyclase/predicted ATPase
MSDTVQFLQTQLAEAGQNLKLIQERKAQFVLETDVPLQIVREERRLETRIDGLRARLAHCLADVESLMARGERAAGAKLWAEAMASYESALEIDPENEAARQALAQAQEAQAQQRESDASERERLEQAIAHMEGQRAILGDAVVDATIAAVRKELAALTAPVWSEQRKQVTILFADVSGFTAMSETMDAEDVRDTMNDLWTRLDGAILDHGGLIDKHIGDCVMALFGAPTAQEDDPERAIRAALAMQAGLAAFREERRAALAMRIGINTGPVFLGEVGTTAEYTAMGDPVNLASRLEHAAPVGGILISHDTFRHVRGVFDVQPLEPISVKGKAEPVQVYVVQSTRLLSFRDATRGVEGVETRMIGRDAELQQLCDLLDEVMQEGEAEAVTVVGEAGVGKSRLLHEFRSWVERLPEPVTHFRGRASQQASSQPYGLIRDVFARRFEIQDSDPAAVARDKLERGIVALFGAEDAEGEEKAHFLGQLVGFDFSQSPHLRGIAGDARQIHDRAFHYAAQLLARAAAPSPSLAEGKQGGAVLFLEDLHWADEGSLDMVGHLLWECRDAPLLIVAMTRPSLFERRPLWGEGEEHHTRVELVPLSEGNAQRLVQEILRKVEDIPPRLRDMVVEAAAGNPFHLEELIKTLIEDGVVVKGADRWQVRRERLAGVRVPPSLTRVLQARLDRLAPLERETLQRASVVGNIFWDGAVEQVGKSASQQIGKSADWQIGGGNGVREALRALRGRELVFQREASAFAEVQEYVFKHALLRDVTYESVLKRLRLVYHAQVAAWLVEQSRERGREYAGLIGEHYERAGENAQAAEWYGQAGRQAQEAFALEAALDYYGRALAVEERWAWRKGQVEVLHVLGRRDEEQAGLEVLGAALRTPATAIRRHDREADVAYLWGQYHDAVGDYPQAHAAFERAWTLCRDQADQVGKVRCLERLGFVAWRQGHYDEAEASYRWALSVLRGRDARSDEEARVLAQVLNGLGTVQRQQGQFDEAETAYQQALALNRASGDRMGEARTLNNLGVTAYYRRNFAGALAHHQQALEIRRTIGDRAGEGESLSNLAMTVREAGDYGQAETYLSDALAIQQALRNRWEEVNVWNELGILHRELGNLPQAQTCLQQGLQLSREIGDEAGQMYILSNLGLVVRDRGDLEGAERLLTDGLVLSRKGSNKYAISYFFSYLGSVSLQAGRLEEAAERAEGALALRRELDMRLNSTDDLATLAAIHLAADDLIQALDYTRRALAILDECGGEGPEFPQRGYFICYQVLSAAGRKETAQVALQSAYRLVMARAEKITDPALRRSFLDQVAINREIVQEHENVMRDA